jgi:putative peptidoglycan binding protein
VPRKILNEDHRPRRRGSRRIAADADVERGLAIRIFLHSPKDMIASGIALVAIIAIIANALFLQAGRHPAPMFGSVTILPAVAMSPAGPLPRSRPAEADASQPESRPAADFRVAEPKAADPLGNLVKTTVAAPGSSINIPRPPVAIPVSHVDGAPASAVGSRRVAAVQRALTENGYGQLKLTGVAGPETQAAIQKFERARKLPVTGQVSDRLMRELVAVIGHPIE